MLAPLHCIALRTVKFDDRHNIVTAWSAERGRVGLLIPAGASREAARRRALMMPMGLFEGQADIRPGRDLFNIRDVRPTAVLPSISAEPAKSLVAMFLAEVLEKILRDSPADAKMTEFIFRSVELLDRLPARGVASFPLVFLSRLSAFFGIEPDISLWAPGKGFDMTGGIYRHSAPVSGKWLSPDQARVARTLQRLTYSSAARLALPRIVRREALERLLEYYSIHLAPLSSLRTLPVIREIL